MTEVTITFYSLIVNHYSDTEKAALTTHGVNNIGHGIYIPPNYGAPDSEHGSGTR